MRLLGSDARRTAAITAAALSMTFCGGGGKGGSPTQPVAIATPTPTPTPAPSFQPLSATCARLPLGSAKYTCRDETASFMTEVNDAIDTLRAQHPEYFNAAGDHITNAGAYYVGVIRLLDKQNICAAFDGEELAVKNSPDFSDQYKIQTSSNLISRRYIGTCYPAVFPLTRDNPPASPPGCKLAPSTEITCGDLPAQFDGDVDKAIGQVLAQKPELFDFSNTAKGTDWPAIKDFMGYHNAVIAVLDSYGYCAKFDGEEVPVKRTNDFTEHYKINLADKYVRRGSNDYRGTCYPAAF
ncbi:MAG TPA: hypothetical protein VEQ10_03000 [Vicinamibacteria bacterium]|nr:hypothetical protein [Vicinamibacteria bacterium]